MAYRPEDGWIAFLTNFDWGEDLNWEYENPPSWGTLVLKFFSEVTIEEFKEFLSETENYKGYNLVFGDLKSK